MTTTCSECGFKVTREDAATLPLCQKCNTNAQREAFESRVPYLTAGGNIDKLRELIAEHGGEASVRDILEMRGVL